MAAFPLLLHASLEAFSRT